MFDHAGYLRRNPGLVEAIEARVVESAWDHYDKHGRREGRLPNDVDPDFYLASYPMVAADLGRAPGRGDAAAHFVQRGRARGYLPNAAAARPSDPGSVASPFGGLWTDRADVADLVQNRLDLGRISDRQAERLLGWARDGYAVLELGSVADRLAPARLALEQIFAGIVPGTMFHCPALAPDPIGWTADLAPHPTAALDVHYLSKPIRSAILAIPVARFLTELFDSPVAIAGTEGVLRPILRPPQQDSAVLPHTMQRHGATLWFGLDDPPDGAGLHVYPGSHRFADYRYADRYKSPEEARRMDVPDLVGEETRHTGRLLTAIRRGGLARLPLDLPFGSVAVLHPDLVHETTAAPELSVRRGIRAWVAPRYAAPLYAERIATRLHPHERHVFASAVYADREPLDNPPLDNPPADILPA